MSDEIKTLRDAAQMAHNSATSEGFTALNQTEMQALAIVLRRAADAMERESGAEEQYNMMRSEVLHRAFCQKCRSRRIGLLAGDSNDVPSKDQIEWVESVADKHFPTPTAPAAKGYDAGWNDALNRIRESILSKGIRDIVEVRGDEVAGAVELRRFVVALLDASRKDTPHG